MAVRMQQRRGTSTQWTTVNNGDGPLLAAGEIGFETNTGKFKIGDGVNYWIDLPYFVNDDGLTTSLGDYVEISTLNSPNGVATLDANGLLSPSQIPPLTITDVHVVADQTARLALTAEIGDVAVQQDTGDSYILASSPASTNANWVKLTAASEIDAAIVAERDEPATLTNKTISYDDNTITVQVANVSDLTATASELNILDGATLTTTELNYVDGVTSSIQTQLDSKLASADLAEAARDAIGSALTSGTGITITPNDNADTITVAVTANTYDAYGSASTAASNASSALTSHENDTTNIHGISDTSKLVTTDDSGTVTSTMIANGTIVNADINASAAIALSKLATDPLARANHTGTQTASTISDFDTQVRTSRLDQMANPTASVSLNSQKITNLADPDNAQDAATKAYVDASTAGLNVHDAVRVATTANVNLNNGLENGDTIDGITLATGNRVLVKNQNTAANNGVYVVQNNGAAVRATDYDSTQEVDAGDFIFVQDGTVNGKTGWVQTNTITTIGSDDIAFTQFSGAGTYLAGTGLTLTGNTFSIDTGTTVDLSTAQTLTNKTLTSPTITGTGSIAGTFTGNITGNVTGNVSGNAGTVTNGVYTTDTGTVTNTMLAGSIANAKLANSSVTIGSTSVSLGDTQATIAGLTLTSPTLTTPALGTPASGVMTNVTGLPLTTGVTGTLPIANGGTGATTAMTAATALLPSQTGNSGKYLTNDGSGTLSWATVSGYSAPTLGSTSIASGSTVTTIAGLTLSGATLTGSLTAGGSAGTSGYVLTSTGSGVQWAAASGGGADEIKILMGAY